MTRRLILWTAFVLVHVGVAWLGWLLPNQPMGDVYLVYEPWSTSALQGGGIVGIDEKWVYPQLALIPMVLAHAFVPVVGSYIIAWAILVTLLDAVVFAILLGRGRSVGRTVGAWFWLAALAALGPVGMYRLDALTVAIAILAALWLVGRPWLASILLAIATWIKVWPAAMLAAAFVAVRRRGAIVGGAVIVTVLTIAAVVAAGGAEHLFGFIGDQTGRGLQVESPVAAFYLWGTALGLDGFFVYYDQDILTFQVTGTQIDVVIALMTPLLLLAMIAVLTIGAIKAWRGATFHSLFPVLSLALVTCFIAVNKVGSPQYIGWLVPPVLIGLVLDRRRWAVPAVVVLVTSVLTQIIYPIMYNELLAAVPVAVTILTVRNILVVALFVWMTVRLVRVPVPARSVVTAPIPAL